MSAVLGLVACGDGPRGRDARPAPASAPEPAPRRPSTPPPVVQAKPTDANEAQAALQLQQPLLVPLPGVGATMLRDTYDDVRGSGRHEALDIMAPRGTPVLAVADGRVAKLFTSQPGGLTVYQFDSSNRMLAYYYAHLDSYADGLQEGMELRRGQLLGTVGSSGNASGDAPHLHFAVFVLGPERQWWKGTPVNPFPLFAARR